MSNNKTEYSSSRLEAFSDGIFAIAITLLVLNIQLPENASQISINKALQLSLPKLEVWIISFFIIGGMWIRHHKLLKMVKCINSAFIHLNLIYLMFVTAIPWLVSLIIVYTNQPISIAVFSGGITLLGIVNLFIWIYLSYIKKVITEDISKYEQKLILMNNITYIGISLLSILLAFTIGCSIALYCYLLNPVIEVMLKRFIKK